MAERKSEEIKWIVDGINEKLIGAEKSDGGAALQATLDSGVLSAEFKRLVELELEKARWQGLLDGIKYTRGEDELTDITAYLRTMEFMRKYLPPSSELMELLHRSPEPQRDKVEGVDE